MKGETKARTPSKFSMISDFLCVDQRIQSNSDNEEDEHTTENRSSISSDNLMDSSSSPYTMSPYQYSTASPYAKSPWIHSTSAVHPYPDDNHPTGLIGSMVREEGHIYSLAASGDLLYTGSESKNVRIWKKWKEYSEFKSGSGLVKAIIISEGKIFTGHQDGKIRVWKNSPTDPAIHKRVGTLPRMQDFLKSSINPANYVEVRRHRSAVWLRHFDAVSCLSLDHGEGILYSGSWDKTVKVWRVSDSKCLESFTAHDDAINSVVAAGGGIIYTGSADGTVKQWRRETVRRGKTKHTLVQTLLQQESAVTSIAVSASGSILYSGSSDGVLNWWRCGPELSYGGALRGHRMAILCLATSGNIVITGSADKNLCVWRRDELGVHTKVSILSGHDGPIKCLAVDEDQEAAGGDLVVCSGSLDGSVKVWRVADRQQQVTAESSPWATPARLSDEYGMDVVSE